jgi:hypothetical protein
MRQWIRSEFDQQGSESEKNVKARRRRTIDTTHKLSTTFTNFQNYTTMVDSLSFSSPRLRRRPSLPRKSSLVIRRTCTAADVKKPQSFTNVNQVNDKGNEKAVHTPPSMDSSPRHRRRSSLPRKSSLVIRRSSKEKEALDGTDLEVKSDHASSSRPRHRRRSIPRTRRTLSRHHSGHQQEKREEGNGADATTTTRSRSKMKRRTQHRASLGTSTTTSTTTNATTLKQATDPTVSPKDWLSQSFKSTRSRSKTKTRTQRGASVGTTTPTPTFKQATPDHTSTPHDSYFGVSQSFRRTIPVALFDNSGDNDQEEAWGDAAIPFDPYNFDPFNDPSPHHSVHYRSGAPNWDEQEEHEDESSFPSLTRKDSSFRFQAKVKQQMIRGGEAEKRNHGAGDGGTTTLVRSSSTTNGGRERRHHHRRLSSISPPPPSKATAGRLTLTTSSRSSPPPPPPAGPPLTTGARSPSLLSRKTMLQKRRTSGISPRIRTASTITIPADADADADAWGTVAIKQHQKDDGIKSPRRSSSATTSTTRSSWTSHDFSCSSFGVDMSPFSSP